VKNKKEERILLYGEVCYLRERRGALSTLFRLEVPSDIVEEILAQARAELPDECCGLLAGHLAKSAAEVSGVARTVRRYPLTNAAKSPTEYLSDPASLFAAYREMHQLGLEILAIYHSHPTAPPVPSRRDIERNNYGADVVHLIVSLEGAEPVIRAWRLSAESYAEAEWMVVSSP
jgi:[CysO sulfur-carrier protein]-S-L-cysteine hydrolase